MFGRDLTFTGRTDIWSYVVDAIKERPVLGYGYGAFWRADGFASYFVANRFGFFVSHAHSSMLDASLDLGVPFSVLVSLMLVMGFMGVGKRLLVGRNVRSQALWSALLIGLGITSLSEPVWLVHTALATPLFWIAVAFSKTMPADTGGSLGV